MLGKNKGKKQFFFLNSFCFFLFLLFFFQGGCFSSFFFPSFSQFFLFIIIIILKKIHPCLFSQGRCILLFLLFLFFLYLFSFLSFFFPYGLLFFPFFLSPRSKWSSSLITSSFLLFSFHCIFSRLFFKLLFSFFSLFQVGCGHLGSGDG